MHFFIDEGGQFTPASGWGVVCSLALPHKEVGPARREINWISKSWPRVRGELKGGSLSVAQLEALVDVLYRRDALLHACSIDVSREDSKEIEHHQAMQAEGITKYLVPEHHPNFIREVWDLRRALERMPAQLYIQCVLMSELVVRAVEETTMYFAQRRPRELANFEWTIDAKDPLRITNQEQWWRDSIAPLYESRSQREPMNMVQDSAFDYRYFERKYSMRKEMWCPDKPREMVDGHDIKKMITEHMAFVDSRSETLIQAVDILSSFLRRLLEGQIAGNDVVRALGRLQIIRTRDRHPQSLRVLTMSQIGSSKIGLFKTLRAMTIAGRSMMKPKRYNAA
jgi:hypothetical protein